MVDNKEQGFVQSLLIVKLKKEVTCIFRKHVQNKLKLLQINT